MKKRDDLAAMRRLWPSLGLLAFGLLTLAFLIAIGRPHWFSIRPVSGAAVAMSYAADRS